MLAVGFVARVPARVETKLLVAFLTMVALLVVLGAVGLGVLGDAHRRTDDLIGLQRKIAAYRQVQQDTTVQLYGVSSALLAVRTTGRSRRRCASSNGSATTLSGCSSSRMMSRLCRDRCGRLTTGSRASSRRWST